MYHWHRTLLARRQRSGLCKTRLKQGINLLPQERTHQKQLPRERLESETNHQQIKEGKIPTEWKTSTCNRVRHCRNGIKNQTMTKTKNQPAKPHPNNTLQDKIWKEKKTNKTNVRNINQANKHQKTY